MLTAAVATAGCSKDIFDLEVNLQPRVYTADFGSSSGSIPTITCSPSDPETCRADDIVISPASATGGDLSIACDPTTLLCFAQTTARAAVTLDVLMDDNFTTKVERRGVSFVRVADLAYTIPTNTLTFDLPELKVYAGPDGTTTETDPGVQLIDVAPSIPAGLTVTEAMHLTLADNSPARALIETSIRNEKPFVLVFFAAPRIDSGGPVPAGAVEVDLAPRILLGLPR